MHARRHLLQLFGRGDLASRAAEAIGAHTVADKLDRVRSVGDIVAIRLPAAPGAWRTRRVKMFRREGNDQAAEAMARGGWHGYEPPLPTLIVESVRRLGGHFVDVGANTGLYSLLAVGARRDVIVHAFEPFPPVVALLRENLSLNAAGHRVRVVEAAVAECSGEIALYVPPATGQLIETSCSLDPAFKSEGHVSQVVVPCRTLDHIWLDLGSPAVGVVKIDAEGAEVRVLAGAANVLRRARPLVFYEVLPGADVQRLQALADEADYGDVRLRLREVIVGDAVRYDDAAWNHALVPVEKLADVEEMAVGVGLRWSSV